MKLISYLCIYFKYVILFIQIQFEILIFLSNLVKIEIQITFWLLFSHVSRKRIIFKRNNMLLINNNKLNFIKPFNKSGHFSN